MKEADDLLQKLGGEENEASSLRLSIESGLKKKDNLALNKKHLGMATSWEKKLGAKKSQLLKAKGMAVGAKPEIFKQKDNTPRTDFTANWYPNPNLIS